MFYATNSNESKIDSLEKVGPEATKNLVLDIDSKLKGYDESTSQKLRETEDNIQKNTQDIASQSSLLREHTENMNTFISTNTIFTNQFLALEQKSEDFLEHLQVERLRIVEIDRYLVTADIPIPIPVIGIGIGIGMFQIYLVLVSVRNEK